MIAKLAYDVDIDVKDKEAKKALELLIRGTINKLDGVTSTELVDSCIEGEEEIEDEGDE